MQEIARRLDDRFALLRDPTSRAAERRRALAGAIGWSYDLLFPDDQRGLWALSCFAGGAPLAAAEHVLAALGVPPAPSWTSSTRLVDRSLVSVDSAGDGRCATGCSTASAPSPRTAARGRAARPRRAAHAAVVRRSADGAPAGARGRASRTAWRSSAPSGPTSTPRWRGAPTHEPAARGPHRHRVRLDLGGAGRRRRPARRGSASALAPATPPPRPGRGAAAGRLAGGVGRRRRARRGLTSTARRARRPARRDELLRGRRRAAPRLPAHPAGPPARRLGAAAAASLATYRALDLAWETAASLLLAAYGSIMLGDTAAAATRAARRRWGS